MVMKGVFHRRGHYEMVEKAGLYWHFVDLIVGVRVHLLLPRLTWKCATTSSSTAWTPTTARRRSEDPPQDHLDGDPAPGRWSPPWKWPWAPLEGVVPGAWHLVKWTFIVLTLVKATYIVMTFMHLGDERRNIRALMLLPYALFLLYLVFIAIWESNYVNRAWEMFL